MKKIYILQRSGKVFQHLFLLMLLFSFFTGKINAQTYVNGGLSTGANSSNGVAAPTGFTWSEVQVGNGTAGFSGSITNGFSMADDFIVPAGPSWNVTKFTFYAYSTGWASATSPFTDLRVQVYNTNPSVGSPAPIFGDLATNRLSGTSSANMYRIFNATTGTTRQIYKMEASVSLTLAPGTYWVEWQNDLTGATSNFMPPSTIVGTVTQPGNNAYQRTITGNVWTPLADGANPQDMPFSVDYTTGACAGTPTPGNTISSLATACPGIPYSLSLQNSTPGSGVTYQWQSSPDGLVYTDIPGATNATYNTTMTVATYYQCNVTCTGNTGTSTPVQVQLTPSSGCYCTAGSPDTFFEKIGNVTYSNVNQSSTATGGYQNFLTDTANVVQQSSLPITVTITGPFASDQVLVWIDFNQNGNFSDPGENVYTSTPGVGPHTGNITIPATSLLGPTRMRVRLHDSQGFTPNTTPCGNSDYGEVEDYTVNILPCVPLDITTPPEDATIECGGDATFTIAATGSGPSFSWEERTSASAVWTTVTNGVNANGATISGATTSTLTITGAPVSMDGYQYRTVFSGYCRSTDFTAPATLTVNTLVANVNPPSANICNGTIQQLTLTNITSPQPFSVNVASGPISVAIPDNDVAGANTSLTVAGVPSSAVISGVKVRFTIPHTYSGDLVIALKAPNGKVLNLDYYVTGTFPGGAGFLNTVISSATGLGALSSGTAPYTGTFRPDAQVAATANGPSGPTGFAATVNNFAGLYTTGADANGTWTLAAYDGGAIDVGTITSWDITVDYLAGIPATGVWEPTTPNTIFTDAAATIPYVAGTPANSVYVLPTATTTYTVVVTTPICVSGVTNIPVTVNNPIGTVTAPSNATICENDNTSFTVSAASGNNITYQWQVSTDAGATWNNVTNNSVYSGATTATLSLAGVGSSLDGNQYRAVLTVSACSSTVNSGAATLTVNPLPTVSIGVAPYTQLYPGISTTLTATASPAGATYQWYKDGVPVAGATSSTLTVDVDGLGEYSVTVVDVNGCAGASTASKTISAAPNDIMFIYPSPTTGQFQVRYQSLEGNSLPRTLTIYDSKGSRVYSRTYSINAPYGRMDVDMSNHAKGIYRVELGDLNGKRIKTGTVIIL